MRTRLLRWACCCWAGGASGWAQEDQRARSPACRSLAGLLPCCTAHPACMQLVPAPQLCSSSSFACRPCPCLPACPPCCSHRTSLQAFHHCRALPLQDLSIWLSSTLEVMVTGQVDCPVKYVAAVFARMAEVAAQAGDALCSSGAAAPVAAAIKAAPKPMLGAGGRGHVYILGVCTLEWQGRQPYNSSRRRWVCTLIHPLCLALPRQSSASGPHYHRRLLSSCSQSSAQQEQLGQWVHRRCGSIH